MGQLMIQSGNGWAVMLLPLEPCANLKTSTLAISTLMTTCTAYAGGRHPVFEATRTRNVSHMTGAGLNIRTDNGAITCGGLGGKAELQTSNGSIQIRSLQ